uniref:Chromatin modification-related protein EAF6 n=1 Tax=Tetraselmis sp. GSL018 TaxID=582737 RepID=A0A061QM46_9CHLO
MKENAQYYDTPSRPVTSEGISETAPQGTTSSRSQVSGAPQTSQEWDTKKKQLLKELENVEKQIYDLETTFLENSTGIGQALRGHPLSITNPHPRKTAVKPGDRVFSTSSVTGSRP